MEFEDLSEKVQQEVKRVAAAFEMTTLELVGERVPPGGPHAYIYVGDSNLDPNIVIETENHSETGTLLMVKIRVGNNEDVCEVCIDSYPSHQVVYPSENSACNTLMARGLYQLGFKEEWAWRGLRARELDYPFTAHEKLDFQLSMPHEFWPQTWLDEANGT